MCYTVISIYESYYSSAELLLVCMGYSKKTLLSNTNSIDVCTDLQLYFYCCSTPEISYLFINILPKWSLFAKLKSDSNSRIYL